MSSIDPSGMLIEGRVFTYEAVSDLQNNALRWLVSELFRHFGLTKGDVYRHPEISYKNSGEASSAEWD